MARIIPERRLSGRQRPGRKHGKGAARRERPFRRRLWRFIATLALLPLVLSIALVAVLRVADPPTSAFMLARAMEAGALSDIDYRWRDWAELSTNLPIALVAAEDQRFPQHDGFDLDAIESALQDRERGGALRGASTISQQVAKNLFLWSGRSWLRKGLEAWFTLLIETMWPKQRILEIYANIAEFGDRVYGAEAASQRYFGTSAAELGPAESARLAAVLPSPRSYSARQPGPYVRQRQRWIERQVRQLGGPAYLRDCCAR